MASCYAPNQVVQFLVDPMGENHAKSKAPNQSSKTAGKHEMAATDEPYRRDSAYAMGGNDERWRYYSAHSGSRRKSRLDELKTKYCHLSAVS